jgi:hypothetical protein
VEECECSKPPTSPHPLTTTFTGHRLPRPLHSLHSLLTPNSPGVSSPSALSTMRQHHQTKPASCCFAQRVSSLDEYPATSSGSSTKPPYFIAYALHRTKLHTAVTFAAIVLQHLRARFLSASLVLQCIHDVVACPYAYRSARGTFYVSYQYETPLFHRLRTSSHEAPYRCHLRSHCPSAFKGSISKRLTEH